MPHISCRVLLDIPPIKHQLQDIAFVRTRHQETGMQGFDQGKSRHADTHGSVIRMDGDSIRLGGSKKVGAVGEKGRSMSVLSYPQQHKIEDRHTVHGGNRRLDDGSIVHDFFFGNSLAPDAAIMSGRNPCLAEQQSVGQAEIALRIGRRHATLVHPIEINAMPRGACGIFVRPDFKKRGGSRSSRKGNGKRTFGFPVHCLQQVGNDQKTDQLSAEPDDITLVNTPGSPDLGRITATLTHLGALLRLPASSITIADYGEDFNTLQELIAKVGNTDYWQAIVPSSNAYFTYYLKGFIAILGPEGKGTTPGKNTFVSDRTGSDGNILATAKNDGGTEIPMKPLTIPLSGDGITMERNTRYPLTLSPHTATVTVGSSVPGWGTDEEIPITYGGEPLEDLGNGSYQASSPRALFEFAAIVNGTNGQTANCTLTADIDLKGTAWTPIGKQHKAYTGTFDGGGHTIRNLTVSGGNNSYQGFFGSIEKATVKNLTIESGTVSGFNYVGAIAGTAVNSTIANCHNVGVTVTANSYAGGIVGRNNAYNRSDNDANATLTVCTNTGSVTASSNGSKAGGIAGHNFANNTGNGSAIAKVTHCYWLENTPATGIGGSSNGGTATENEVKSIAERMDSPHQHAEQPPSRHRHRLRVRRKPELRRRGHRLDRREHRHRRQNAPRGGEDEAVILSPLERGQGVCKTHRAVGIHQESPSRRH